MASVGDLVAKLKLNTRGFTGPLKKSSRDIGMFSKGLGNLAATGGVAAAGLLVTAGAVVVLKRAVGEVVSELKEAFDRLDSLAKTGARLGVPTEKLAGLRFAAGLAGASVKELDIGLQNLARRSSEAADGTGEGVEAFKKLGINAKQFNELSVDKQFEKITRSMGKLKNQNDKVGVAFDLFGRSGVKLLNLMDAGVGNLRAAMAKAQLMGIAPTADQLARIEAANDAINALGQAWDGIFNTLAIDIAPAIIVVAKETSAWLMLAKNLATVLGVVSERIRDMPSPPVIGKLSLAIKLTQDLAGWFSGVNDKFDEGRKKLEAQVEVTKELRNAIAEVDAAEAKRNKLKAFAAGVKESLLTPLQRFERDVHKLGKALGKNLIDDSDFSKARAQFTEKLFLENGVTAALEKQKKLREDAARTQQREVDALREQAKREQKLEIVALRDAAKQVAESVRSPFEVFRDEVSRLKDLQKQFPRILSLDTLNKAIGDAREQFEDATGGPSDTTITRALAGSEVGSKDFFDAIQRSRTGSNSPEQKTAKATAKIALSQDRQERLLIKVAANTRKQTVFRGSNL